MKNQNTTHIIMHRTLVSLTALHTLAAAQDHAYPSVCEFDASSPSQTALKSSLIRDLFTVRKSMHASLAADTLFTAADKQAVDLTGTEVRMSYGGVWKADSLHCEDQKFSGHLWETAYLLHKLTNAVVKIDATAGWGASGLKGNPDKEPMKFADGADSVIVGWKGGPTPVRSGNLTAMTDILGSPIAPSNFDNNLRLDLVTRPGDKAQFEAVLAAATLDPQDRFAVARVLMTTPMTFNGVARIPRVCSCPCALFNQLLYGTSGLTVDVNYHAIYGVSSGIPATHEEYAYDAQWYNGVLFGECDYTVVATDNGKLLDIAEYDFQADAPTGSGLTYRDLIAHIPATSFGNNHYVPLDSDEIYVTKDAPGHDKLVSAFTKISQKGLYDLVQSFWDSYDTTMADSGASDGGVCTAQCKNLTGNVPPAHTPLTDDTFSSCAAQTPNWFHPQPTA
tara:strand:- start:1954 stop:3300 length:1347 start_codon:yes stop_codon:yes gene_type:complete